MNASAVQTWDRSDARREADAKSLSEDGKRPTAVPGFCQLGRASQRPLLQVRVTLLIELQVVAAIAGVLIARPWSVFAKAPSHALGLTTTTDGVNQSVELSGDTHAVYYFPNGQPSFADAGTFTMCVRTDGRYRIRMVPLDGSMDYAEVAWDGTNGYCLKSFLSYVQQRRSGGENVGSNVATAIITTNPVPQFRGPIEVAGLLWCAFVAPFYLRDTTVGREVYVPFSTGMYDGSPADAGDYVQKPAFWRYAPIGPYLEILHYGSNQANDRCRTNAIYTTLQWTNPIESPLPCKGEASLYAECSKLAHFYFTLRTVRLLSFTSARYQPVVPGPTLVTEERFNSPLMRIRFNYMIESCWPSINDVKKMKEYLTHADAARLVSKDTRTHVRYRLPLIFRLILLCVLIGPAVYIAAYAIRKRSSMDGPK